MARPFGILTAIVLSITLAAELRADEVHWLASIDQARQIAGRTNRLVLVHFWATTCEPCLRVEQQVFGRPGTSAGIESRFVPVKINAEQFPQVARQYGVTSWPTDVILAPTGRPLAWLPCPADQAQYLAGLDRAAQVYGTRLVAAYSGLEGPATQPPPPAGLANQPPSAPPASVPPGPASGPNDPYANARFNPSPAPGAGAARPPAAAPSAVAFGLPGPQPPLTSATAASSPPAPLALEGFCPVELLEHERWVRGDRRFGAVHRGLTYLFASPAHQQRFLENPDHYTPALAGCDPVLAVDSRQTVPGSRQHGLFFGNGKRVYLFTSEATLAQFYRDPRRYAEGVRMAEATGGATLR